MGPSPRSGLTARQKLHKQAIGSGWSYTNHPVAGTIYSKAATHSQAGARRTTPPIHPDWKEANTMAGPRYVSRNPELMFSTSATPTDPVAAFPGYQARIEQLRARNDDSVAGPRGDVSGTMQASNSVAQPLSPEAASAKRRAAAATSRQRASAAGDLGYSKSSGLGGSQENLA